MLRFIFLALSVAVVFVAYRYATGPTLAPPPAMTPQVTPQPRGAGAGVRSLAAHAFSSSERTPA